MTYKWVEKMYTNESCGCSGMRNFLTKEEKIEMLSEYKKSLDQEAKAVAERIADLKKNA
jgi:hypothetical protein